MMTVLPMWVVHLQVKSLIGKYFIFKLKHFIFYVLFETNSIILHLKI